MFQTFLNNIFNEALKHGGTTTDELYQEGLSWIFARINIDSPFLIYWLQHGFDLKFLSFANSVEYFASNTLDDTEIQEKLDENKLDPKSSYDEELMTELETEDEHDSYNLTEAEIEINDGDDDDKVENEEEENVVESFDFIEEDETEECYVTNDYIEDLHEDEHEQFDATDDYFHEQLDKEKITNKILYDAPNSANEEDTITVNHNPYGKYKEEEIKHIEFNNTFESCNITKENIYAKENDINSELMDSETSNESKTVTFMDQKIVAEHFIESKEMVQLHSDIKQMYEKDRSSGEKLGDMKEIMEEEEIKHKEVNIPVESLNITIDTKESILNGEIMDLETTNETKTVTHVDQQIGPEHFEESKEMVQLNSEIKHMPEKEKSSGEILENMKEIIDESECEEINISCRTSESPNRNSDIIDDIKIEYNGTPNDFEETEINIPGINIDSEIEDDSAFILNLSELKNVVKNMENIKTDGNLRASIVLEVVDADGSRSRSLTPTPRSRQNSFMSSQLSTIENEIDFNNENLNNTIEILTKAEKLSVAEKQENKNTGSKKKGGVANLRAHFENIN